MSDGITNQASVGTEQVELRGKELSFFGVDRLDDA